MIEINGDNFDKEIIQSNKPVLVDFWGPKCGPCLLLMPQIEKLEEKYGNKIKIFKVDASKNRRLCLNLKVMGLPTFLFYKDGKEVSRFTGNDIKIDEIEEEIKRLIE